MLHNFFKRIKNILKIIIITILNAYNHYSIEKYIRNEYIFYRKVNSFFCIKKFFPYLRFDLYWDHLINSIKEYVYIDRERPYSFLMKMIDKEPKVAVTAIELLYCTRLLDDYSCKKALAFATKTPDKVARYWVTQDISRFTFRLQDGFYKDYYLDRRSLLRQIAKENHFVIPRKKNNESVNKLCIIVPLLSCDKKNSVERFSSMMANGLINYFKDIEVICLDIFSPSKAEQKGITTILPYKAAKSMYSSIREHFDNRITIYFPKQENYVTKFNSVLDEIYQFNPNVIIDTSDEYSVVSYYYSRDFLTIYNPLRDYVSSSFFSYILGNKFLVSKKSKIYRTVNPEKTIEWIHPEVIPDTSGFFCRKQFGIKPNDFVMITIGNNETCLKKDFLEQICPLFDSYSELKWLLIGGNAPKYLKDNYSYLFKTKRIIELGYEKKLYALCKIGDILLRPNTTGGAGAMAIAAYSGLGIVMTNKICDATRWLGTDFSNLNNYYELSNYIKELIQDRFKLDALREKSKSKVELVIKNKYAWSNLFALIKEVSS